MPRPALLPLPVSSALVLHIGLAPLPRRCFGTQRSYHLGNVTEMVSYAAYNMPVFPGCQL
nr:MAG TPA: hypothetical protein [Caudoviricetes sp.]